MEVRGGACGATTAPRAAGVSGCKTPPACHALFISVLANISAWCRKSGSADYLCPCFYSSSSVTTSSSSRRLHQTYGSSPNLPSSVTPCLFSPFCFPPNLRLLPHVDMPPFIPLPVCVSPLIIADVSAA